MKKIIGLLAVSSLVLIISCSDHKTEVKKEVIVVPAAPAPVVVKKPTTIVLDKNGVKVESKKVDVSVKKQ